MRAAGISATRTRPVQAGQRLDLTPFDKVAYVAPSGVSWLGAQALVVEVFGANFGQFDCGFEVTLVRQRIIACRRSDLANVVPP